MIELYLIQLEQIYAPDVAELTLYIDPKERDSTCNEGQGISEKPHCCQRVKTADGRG